MFFEQVLTRVARDAQLGEAHNLNVLAIGQRDEFLDFLNVVNHVGHLYSRYGSSHLDESVFHIV